MIKPTETENNSKKNAKSFVDNLIQTGTTVPCDETLKDFNINGNLPDFYNESLFKRGQTFFANNIFALLYSKFLGLLAILAIPSINKVLVFTKMSGNPMSAYRRYLSTVFHMYIWYKNDFQPGSRLWDSILEVKTKHNAASKRCSSAGFKRITQYDMALTQFGFMGFAVAKRDEVGLHNIKQEDWEGFIHIWRVVGFMMGLEDRFNICRESLEETSEICKLLAHQVLKPAFERKNEDFLKMSKFLCDGMWSMNPCLNHEIYINLAYKHLHEGSKNSKFLIELTAIQKFFYYFLVFTIWSLQFSIVKTYHNYTQYMTMWLMKNFPFLAYYQFGYKNSHVSVGK